MTVQCVSMYHDGLVHLLILLLKLSGLKINRASTDYILATLSSDSCIICIYIMNSLLALLLMSSQTLALV